MKILKYLQWMSIVMICAACAQRCTNQKSIPTLEITVSFVQVMFTKLAAVFKILLNCNQDIRHHNLDALQLFTVGTSTF